MFLIGRAPWQWAGIASFALVTISASLAAAQDQTQKLTLPLTGNLEMPPITPQEAQRFLANRVVPQSDPVPLPRVSGEPPVKLNIETLRGHDLPEDEMTPSGFKRADFAIAKTGSAVEASARREGGLAEGIAIDLPPPAAIIENEPPLIGNP